MVPIGIWFLIAGILLIIIGINGLCSASKKRDKAESAFWDENLEEKV